MPSQSLQALFLRARDQYAASGRLIYWTILVLALAHVTLVTPWIERQKTQSSDAAEARRFAKLPEIATFEEAIQGTTELVDSSLAPALTQLADDLAADLTALDATVRQLTPVPEDGDEAGDEDPVSEPVIEDLPFEIVDPARLAAIRDALADGGAGSSGSRYGLLAALDPVIEEQIATARFATVDSMWQDEARPHIENRLAAAAGALPGLRLRFPEAKSEWSAFEGALSSLRDSVRDFTVTPPTEPFWWASPETARELEIGIPEATAEKIRRPLALDELLTAAETTRQRYGKLAERLESERQQTLASTEARDLDERSFADFLTDLGIDPEAVAGLFPLLLGLVLAAAMVRRSYQLRELGMATRLTIEDGGPLELRDWCLAQLAGRLSDERSAEEAWKSGSLRTLGGLGIAWIWIAAAALQVRESVGADEPRWLAITLIGAAAVLVATIHRLIVAHGLIRLFVASDSDTETVTTSIETPVIANGVGEDETDSDLDGLSLR